MGRTAGRKQEIIIVPEGYWTITTTITEKISEDPNKYGVVNYSPSGRSQSAPVKY